MLKDKTIAFLGTGNMASSMIRGLVESKTVEPRQIIAVNPVLPEQAKGLADTYKIVNGKSSDIANADIVVFAVKPQNFTEALEMYKEFLTSEKLYLSIMAGICISSLEDALDAPVVRLMPNLALSVSLSATAYALGKKATDEHAKITEAFFAPMGLVKQVDESLISTVTALSGSGPAYFFYLVEAMSKAAQGQGMEADTADALALQTLLGSAKLLEVLNVSPEEMRRRVTSKKGTTEAAINTMADEGFCDVVAKGMLAAKVRSDELSAG